ncbi:MAG: PAS domain S-box protein, partial [candidate division Zixibacteria bacterium]|nr:PAS domain S-box protein [candidate division Zixibacteria bacterium]
MAKREAKKRKYRAGNTKKSKNTDLPKFTTDSDTLKLTENRHYGVLIFDPNTFKLVFANSRICKNLGYSKAELLCRKVLSFIAPEDKRRIEENIKARIRGKPLKTGNRYTAIAKDGRKVVFDAYTAPVHYNGQTFLQTITNDVTEEVRLEKELRESEEKYRTVVDNIADGIAICLKGRIEYANRALAQIFGYKLNKIEGTRITHLIAPGYKKEILGLQKKVWQSSNRRKSVIRGLRKDGSEVILNLRASRLKYHGENALQITVTDITAEKESEDELKENEERFRSLVESVQYGFFIIDIKTKRLIYLNRYSQSFLKGFDYDLEELDIFQFLDQEDQKKMADAYKQINNGKITGFTGIQKVVLPRNKSIWIQYESKVVPFQGRICIQGIFKDITEIKEADDRLKESEERFRQMAENIPEVFWILERKPEKMVYVSPAYEDVFGLSLKEIYKDSRSFLKAVHPDDKEFVIKYFDDTQAPSDIEFRLLRKAGEIRWVRALT